jgi:DNA-binding NarL/FixJ family response regulator
LARYLADAAATDESLAVYRAACALLPALPESELTAAVHSGMARVLADAARFPEARREALAAVATARKVGAASEEGRALRTLGAVQLAQDRGPAGPGRPAVPEPAPPPALEQCPDPAVGLTPRERQVLALVAAGESNRQIAARLLISEKTAGVHVSHILTKLGAPSRTAAALAAQRLGLLV